MIKRCKHEYVATSEWLHKEIGPCCKKCGKPLVKHEYFSFSYRTKKAFKIMVKGWAGFKDIDYAAVGQSVTTLISFFLLIAGYALMPFLSILSPLVGFFGFLNVNRKQRNMVKRIYKKTDGDT